MDFEESNCDEIIPYDLKWIQERNKKRKKLLAPTKLQRQIENNSHPRPKWVDAANGRVPTGAFVGGFDSSGKPQYIARAFHEGLLHAAKLTSSGRGCTIRVYGKTYLKTEYQVLMDGHYNWFRTYKKYEFIPPNAIICGQTLYDQALHIVRVKLNDGSHSVPLFIFSNKEWKVKSIGCNDKCMGALLSIKEHEAPYFEILCYGKKL